MNSFLSEKPILSGIILVVIGLGFLTLTYFKRKEYDEDVFDFSISFKGILIGIIFIVFGILYLLGLIGNR